MISVVPLNINSLRPILVVARSWRPWMLDERGDVGVDGPLRRWQRCSHVDVLWRIYRRFRWTMARTWVRIGAIVDRERENDVLCLGKHDVGYSF